MKATKIVNPALVIVLLLLAAASSSAYVLLSPARTWDCPPTYIVDDGGIASISDGDGGATLVAGALQAAAAWNGAGSATILYAEVGDVSGFSLGDGIPMLAFTDPLSACTGTCLAATFTGYYSQRAAGSGSYKIDDADIVTNVGGHSWTSLGEDPGGVGCSSEFYVEGVMVHELGHALGLGHTNVAGATMYPSVSYCNNTPASTEADDEAAIVALYGSAPCVGCDTYTQYLATGQTDYQPCGTYYSSGAGTHNGYLRGPAGTDFDLYLWRWDGSAWVQVASATSASTNENISYAGTAGYYLWGVYSYSGSGTYHFYLDRP